MQKITELTSEQEQAMFNHRDKWLAIGLATGPANVDVLRPVFDRFYAHIGKPPAKNIIRVASPLGANVLINTFYNLNSVLSSVSASVRASVRASVLSSVSDSVLSSVWAGVSDSVSASVWAGVSDSVSDSNRQYIDCRLYGHHDAHWIAFYQYFIQHLGVNADDKHGSIMNDWQTIAENCGWWYAFEDVVIVCDRPTAIHLDERGRLHNATGAALAYADGFCIHAYHGVRMPGDIVDDHTTITPERIQAEQNAEVQRVMIELYGYEAYVRDSQAIELHRDDYGILYKIPTAGDPIIVVNVTCPSTNALYWLSVPEYIDSDLNPSTSWGGEKITTAHQAVAWTWGLTAAQYQPLIES